MVRYLAKRKLLGIVIGFGTQRSTDLVATERLLAARSQLVLVERLSPSIPAPRPKSPVTAFLNGLFVLLNNDGD